jgi:CPA2 family monovalent cation:H+ antiporter-2
MLLDFTLIVLLGTLGGIVAKHFKQPGVIGYLLAGFIGTIFFPHFVKEKESIDAIAQIGVALLLFTLGIEFNIQRVSRVIKVAVIGGIIQIFVSILMYEGLLMMFGIPSYPALFIAAGFALSSTAVVVKILGEKKMLATLPGEIMIAWLLVQDLSVVPLLILLPIVKNGISGATIQDVGIPILLATVLIVFIVTIGRKLTTQMLSKISQYNSQELLLLVTISLCLFVAGVTHLIGLSYALGAFLAGIMIADSREQHAMFSEIRPLRDLFSTIFFVSLALLVPTDLILPFLPFAFFISIFVIVIKFIIVAFITWIFGYHTKVSFLVGVALIQVGEFAFVLVREGLRNDIITESMYALVLTVTIITILLTPFLFTKGLVWYEHIRRILKRTKPRLYGIIFSRGEFRHELPQLPYKDHVVLLGYGRMGKYIGRALASAEIPFVVVEFDYSVVKKLQEENIPVVYGDPTDYDILDFVQVDHARVVVIAIPDLSTQLSVIVNARKLNKKITIISRFHFEEDQKILKSVGADVLIHPEFTASLSAVEKTLSLFKYKKDDIEGKISRLKIEHGME